MHFVDLKTGYFLTGFADFESALQAAGKLCEKGYKVAYLNEASHVRDLEVREYTRSFEALDGLKYQNYHFTKDNQAKDKANESFNTALEVLERSLDGKAKFVMVVSQAKTRQFRKAKAHLDYEQV